MRNVLMSEPEQATPRRFIEKAGILIILTIIYFYAGKLGLSLAFVNPSATAVWPTAGIALAAFLILGNYIWPAILLGAFLVNITTSGAALPSLTIAIGNSFEGLAGVYMVSKYENGTKGFENVEDVLKFFVLVGLIGRVLSVSVGVAGVILGGLE